MRATAAVGARLCGVTLLAAAAVAALGAPLLAPHSPDVQYPRLLNAPPTSIRIRDVSGRFHAPFIYGWRLVDQLQQRYELDSASPVPLRWFAGPRLLTSSDESRAPLMIAGADSFGRDVFSRLVFGARTSLALALVAGLGALLIGAPIGAAAGCGSPAVDDVLMRGSDFLLVLPATYVVLALRAVMPLVLAPSAVFIMLASIFAIVAAPFIARGVRGIVRTERQQDYVIAARSIGASPARVLIRHLLPATRGFVLVQLTLLIPAFIVAEATLSYVGLGFPEPVASWGTMLQDAASLRAFVDFPWLLTPAAAMFLVVFGVNLAVQDRREAMRF